MAATNDTQSTKQAPKTDTCSKVSKAVKSSKAPLAIRRSARLQRRVLQEVMAAGLEAGESKPSPGAKKLCKSSSLCKKKAEPKSQCNATNQPKRSSTYNMMTRCEATQTDPSPPCKGESIREAPAPAHEVIAAELPLGMPLQDGGIQQRAHSQFVPRHLLGVTFEQVLTSNPDLAALISGAVAAGKLSFQQPPPSPGTLTLVRHQPQRSSGLSPPSPGASLPLSSAANSAHPQYMLDWERTGHYSDGDDSDFSS